MAIYLDHAATTPVRREVLEAAWPWLTSEFGNPSSRHELGLRAADALNAARTKVAVWLGCRPSEVIFTSGATESNNTAIIGIALANLGVNPNRKHILSARTEHESVLEALSFLERVHGFEIEWLATNRSGQIATETLQAAIRPETSLVTLMTANNEIGTVHPIAEFAAIAAEARVAFHTDAVQAAGWLNIDVARSGVTSLSLSGHKLGAPKGVGVLYVKAAQPLEPLVHGGGQELELRSGTENVAWAVAFAEALSHLPENRTQPSQAAQHTRALRDALVNGVLEHLPTASLTGAALNQPRHPAIASFVFEGVNGETLLIELENQGVLASSGSACAAGKDDPSHVLVALGYSPDLARTSVRLSFGHQTSAEEVESALNAIVSSYKRIAG